VFNDKYKKRDQDLTSDSGIRTPSRGANRCDDTLPPLQAQLDGAWFGSFYVITDAVDKESYSNAPSIRPGAFEYDSLSMMSVMT
jgi:hypothetical protein